MMTKLKILHAPNEIAGQMGINSRAQRKMGYNAKSMSYSNHPFGYQVDEILNIKKIKSKFLIIINILAFFLKTCTYHNVFHFYSGKTILPNNYDLPILKALGKKMVMHYWGSDVRQKSIAEKNNKYIWEITQDEDKLVRRIKKASKYIDTAIVADKELSGYIKDYYKKVIMIRQAVDLQEYKVSIPSSNNIKPIIVHAPSKKNIKGTEYLIKAMEELKTYHELEFILIHGMDHQQATGIYRKADIIVDQLLGGTYGIFAIESMALGKPVVCYISEQYRESYPNSLPIVSANPDNIFCQLKKLIDNPELRVELGKRGREYVEAFHDSEVIAQQLINIYDQL